MTPARHMRTCVPLPVPRAQASFVMRPMVEGRNDSYWWFVSNAPHAIHQSYSQRAILRHFGPRRPR